MLAMGGAMSAGAEATVGVPRQKGSEVLPLSKESSMKLPDGNEVAINMLWETDLANVDDYQDNASIALSGNVVYLCIGYCEPFETGESRDNIFIRRFKADTGEELQPLIFPTTAELRKPQGGNPPHNFVIANDDFGNLLMASCYRINGDRYEAHITLIPFDEDGMILADKVEFDLDNNEGRLSTETDSYNCRIDLNRISGNITSGKYTVEATVIWTNHPHFTKYAIFDIDKWKVTTAPEYIPYYWISPNSDFYEYDYTTGKYKKEYKFYRPELHKVAGTEMFVASDKMDVNGATTPTLFKSYSYSLQRQETLTAGTHQAVPDNSNGTCRGFYTFRHGNQLLATYAAHCSPEKGTQFYLSSWEDPKSFATLGAQNHTFPDVAFKYPQHPYSTYRQVAVSRSVDTDNISGWTRPDGDTTPVTDLFVCAPGSGIAAMRLAPHDHATGISTMEANPNASPRLRLEGNLLVADTPTDFDANASSPLYLIITDLSGRTVYHARFTGAPLPLDRFAPGVYIATLGPSRLKIALH